MGDIWFHILQNLEGGYMVQQCGRDREVEKKACCQGSLTPVSERELCCCEHCKHSTLEGAEHPFHFPILPVFVAWNNVLFDLHFFQSADELMTSQFSCPIH